MQTLNIGYCGNALQAGSTLQTLTDCSFICPGNAFEYCGAGSRLELYKNSNAPSTPTTSASTGTPTTPSVPSTPPIGNFAYQGCYIDGANGRILNHQQPDNQNLTPENCVALCAANQYTIAGVEYGVQCFCDTAIYNGGTLDPNQGDCTTPCSGNANEMCGGPNGRMNLYSVGTPQVYVPPSIQKTGLPTNWTYSGCLE
jgi:WSC domain